MTTTTHQSQQLATIVSTLESIARGRGVRVRRLTIGVPSTVPADAIGAALARRLSARGMAEVDVHVVVGGHETRVVAVEYERD